MASHILVIDDQISLARFIALELDAAGYQVSTAYTVELPLIEKLNPDLLVLSWELRAKSALDICQQLRAKGNRVPIVMLTAQEESSCRSALQGGAQACLAKPFSMSKLLETIGHHLRWRLSDRACQCGA